MNHEAVKKTKRIQGDDPKETKVTTGEIGNWKNSLLQSFVFFVPFVVGCP